MIASRDRPVSSPPFQPPSHAFDVLVDPCTLLTQAQVSAALGVSVGPGEPTSGRICRWAEPGHQPGLRPAVVLTMQDQKAFDFAKRPTKSAVLVKEPVSGVGDDAVFNTMTVTATLTVKKGDEYFEIHIYGFPVDKTKTLEQKLAEEVVANLK